MGDCHFRMGTNLSAEQMIDDGRGKISVFERHGS
jgi:hypothetical protein